MRFFTFLKNTFISLLTFNYKLFVVIQNLINRISYLKSLLELGFFNLPKPIRRVELNEKIHFHSLRYSFASMSVQKGVLLFIIKELLGHEDLATTQIYIHLQQNLRDSIGISYLNVMDTYIFKL